MTRFGLTFFSRLPPPTESTRIRSSALEAADRAAIDEDGGPALVVGPGRQLGDVVGRGVGLDAGDLAEVVDGVRGVGGAAADAQDEQPPAALAQSAPAVSSHPLDRLDVQAVDDLLASVEILCCRGTWIFSRARFATQLTSARTKVPGGEIRTGLFQPRGEPIS